MNDLEHIKNSYLYRIKNLISIINDKLNDLCDKNRKYKNKNRYIMLNRLTKNLLNMQFMIPFIHTNIDIITKIKNDEFIIERNNSIVILEKNIQKADKNILNIAHEKLDNYILFLRSNKKRTTLDKNILTNEKSVPTTYKQHLAYSYLYKLSNKISISNMNKNDNYCYDDNKFNETFNPKKIPKIPGLIYNSSIEFKIDKKNKQIRTIDIDVDEILNLNVNELIKAHSILNNFLNIQNE